MRFDAVRPAAGLLGLAAIGALVFAGTSPTLLPIEQVSVLGARHLTSDQVADASGLVGQPVFRASAFDARARLAALPALRSLTVEIALRGSARIEIVEREALGRWVFGGVEWLVDAEGVLFASREGADTSLPRVVDERAAPEGGRIEASLALAALQLARIAPGELRADALAPIVTVDRGGSLVLRVSGGWEVRFGLPDRLAEKLAIARAYLQRNPERRLDYVDVARPEFIVVKPE